MRSVLSRGWSANFISEDKRAYAVLFSRAAFGGRGLVYGGG